MLRKSTEEFHGFQFDHPRLAVVVTCHAKDTDNAMTIAWHSPLSENPPLIGLAIHPDRLAYELILEAQEFAINFLPVEKADLLAALGVSTGKQGNKFEQFHLAREKALKIAAPIIHEAYAVYECVLHDHCAYGDHEWFVGRLVATDYDEAVLKDGVLDVSRVNPALYLGREQYVTTQRLNVRYVPSAETARKLQL